MSDRQSRLLMESKNPYLLMGGCESSVIDGASPYPGAPSFRAFCERAGNSPSRHTAEERPFKSSEQSKRSPPEVPHSERIEETNPLCRRLLPEGTARRRLRRTHADEPPKLSWIFLKNPRDRKAPPDRSSWRFPQPIPSRLWHL